MYRYETHLHTYPVSKCAIASVRESLLFYKSLGYDGVFITNHFLDGNINIDSEKSYEEKLKFFFSDYEEALGVGEEIGIKVFSGVEISHKGTHFLIYGLNKTWYLAHPEIMDMQKSGELPLMMKEGALVIQAHPFREDKHIDHIRLYPRCVHGFEVINAGRPKFENDLAGMYAPIYGLPGTAGSDNHVASRIRTLAGMMSETPINCEADYKELFLSGKMQIFCMDNPNRID
jgi:hypothetical protein